jgi:hypothetical protein
VKYVGKALGIMTYTFFSVPSGSEAARWLIITFVLNERLPNLVVENKV